MVVIPYVSGSGCPQLILELFRISQVRRSATWPTTCNLVLEQNRSHRVCGQNSYEEGEPRESPTHNLTRLSAEHLFLGEVGEAQPNVIAWYI